MRNFQYNFALLKETRENKKISKLEMAHQLCLSVNQINSIEEDSFSHFPAESIKLAAIKKYAKALHLKIDQVIFNVEDDMNAFKTTINTPSTTNRSFRFKKGTYSNKANYLIKAWKDLLTRLLKK
jgi:cytoskeletal protein RodZ